MKGILWQKQSNTHTSNWQFKSELQARLGTLGERVARSSWDIGKRVARSSWGIGKRVARSSWDIGKRVARSSWGFPKQPTARSNDNLPRSWQATFSSCIKHWCIVNLKHWEQHLFLNIYVRKRTQMIQLKKSRTLHQNTALCIFCGFTQISPASSPSMF